MALNKVNYVDNQTVITAQNLNNIQNEIIQNTKLIKNVAPRNLLDNSDFQDPVNQLGFKSGTAVESNAGFIDRWRNGGGSSITPNLSSNGIEPNGAIYQTLYLPSYVGKKMTLAVGFSEGNVVIASGILTEASTDYKIFFNTTDGINEIGIGSWGGIWIVGINCPNSIIQWAALYEGEYTTETLPEYQPKGYENELLVCHQYNPYTDEYIGLSKFSPPRNLLDNSDFRNPVNQREYESGAGVSDYDYFLDRWKHGIAEKTNYTLSSAGLGIPSRTYIVQVNETIRSGTYTFAVKQSDGSITILNCVVSFAADGSYKRCGTISADGMGLHVDTKNGYVVCIIQPYKDVVVEWAAFYEGSYTADTLPPYVPKGYGAELAECLRYFQKGGQACTVGTQYGSTSIGIVRLGFVGMRITPTIKITGVSNQGWGNITADKLTGGWISKCGNIHSKNYLISGDSSYIGQTVGIEYEASADL